MKSSHDINQDQTNEQEELKVMESDRVAVQRVNNPFVKEIRHSVSIKLFHRFFSC